MTNPENKPALGAEQSESGAFVVSEKHYHGRPCKNCGGTLRYKSNCNCVACKRRWLREKRADPEYLQRERERLREKQLTDPAWHERRRERHRKWWRERRKDREWVERDREQRRISSSEYYRVNAERTNERRRERRRNDPERERERDRERRLKQRDERILADPTIQEFLRMQNPLVKKLEAMIADRAASQGEKDNAYRILERKGLLPTSNRRNAWLLRQTTFGATPNTQHEMKSLPS